MRRSLTGKMILAILFNYPSYRLEDVLKLTPQRVNFLFSGLSYRKELMEKEKKKRELKEKLRGKLDRR